MGKQDEKKFTWVIKNFSSLPSEEIFSEQFEIGGCKWRLSAYPKGKKGSENYLSLYLNVADYESLPSGSRRHVRYNLTVVNQNPGKNTEKPELQYWFDEKSFRGYGYPNMILLSEIHAKDSGFLVNDQLKVSTELEVLEVIGKVDVNGFHILPSQVEFVSRMFERYPMIASEVVPKNTDLRTGYMSLLLSLIESLRRKPFKLTSDDLDDAQAALDDLKCAGFKLEWLENKLNEVIKKKEKEKAGESRLKEIENELKELKQKCSDLEGQLEKEKAEVSAAKSPITFDVDF